MGLDPARDETMITCPPRWTRWGSAARVRRKTAVRFVPMTVSQPSSVVSATVERAPTPALLTRICRPPKQSTAAATAPSQAEASRRSPAKAMPRAPTVSISSTSEFELGGRARDDGEARPLAGKGEGDRPADPPAGPGDESGSVADLHAGEYRARPSGGFAPTRGPGPQRGPGTGG